MPNTNEGSSTLTAPAVAGGVWISAIARDVWTLIAMAPNG